MRGDWPEQPQSYVGDSSGHEGRQGCFNPCLFHGCVYMCGQGSKLMELFSPQTASFLTVQLKLSEDNPCCLIVHNNLLVVHSKIYISRFAAGKAGELIRHSQRSQTDVNKWSYTQPVVDHTQGLFFIYRKQSAFVINATTGKRAKVN